MQAPARFISQKGFYTGFRTNGSRFAPIRRNEQSVRRNLMHVSPLTYIIMANGTDKSVLERIGCNVSTLVSDVAAHPYAQVGVILVCGLWWLVGLPTDILTATLSIMAITLTQMVLNRQDEREADDRRRDVAMHAKIDELVIAMKGARNEMVGIEELDEADIRELKQDITEAIDEAGEAAGDPGERAAAKRAATQAVDEETHKVRARPGRKAVAGG